MPDIPIESQLEVHRGLMSNSKLLLLSLKIFCNIFYDVIFTEYFYLR